MTTALAMPQTGAAVETNSLNGQQKAAIIVRLLLSDGGNISLTDLPDSLQTNLVHQMAGLRHVDHATMIAVVEEFLLAFDGTGLSFPGALEETLTLLDGCVSPQTARRIRQQAGLAMHADPWARISGMDTEGLLAIVENETIEISAVILSKLKVSTAAELLGQLPGERARRITYAVSLTGDISPKIVQTIGQSIAEQLDTVPDREFDDGPVERVGAILNFSPTATREDMLEGLQQADAGFADLVRKAIFTFANIPERIDPRDVPKITRDVDPADLVTALVAAQEGEKEVADFILDNMSQRMADQIREEMEEKGEVKLKDGEAAMTSVVITVRGLADSGEIFLVAEEE
ncbi:MAG: FliG C-terminal domain-containing protein [Paracoccaceae bacterium]